jgi:glycosyltransferase involved in cell wall biosynthesis
MPDTLELTILMPCLNEVETLAACIKKARTGLERSGAAGEILVADNGSTDGSIELAEKMGARVVHVKQKGYGNALRYGVEAARGKWVLMGDADDSYDFADIEGFLARLREGNELVMGCRLPRGGGTIMAGAMPWKNRWIGNPLLSFLGRLFFHSPAQDFHSGLRAFTKDAFERMELKTTGMEFASEMVIKATLKNMRIAEVPITLHKDGRSRPPHLKPWRDGWRHLRFMLIYSPRWLFLAPGVLLGAAGFVAANLTYWAPFKVHGVVFDAGSLMVACMWMIIGMQFVALACFTKVFAIAEGLLPDDPRFSSVFRYFTLERGIVLGAAVLALGIGILTRALWIWEQAGYGQLDPSQNLRRLIAAATLIVLGIQAISASFFMSILGLKTTTRRPPAAPESGGEGSGSA